jgi:hypothetical protein
VLEGIQEPAAPVDEMDDAADVHLPEPIEDGMIHGFAARRIAERPTDLRTAPRDLKVVVLTGGDPLVDLAQAAFQRLLQRPELLGDRIGQPCQAGVDQQLLPLPPLSIVQEVVLEAAKTDTVSAEDLAGFEAVAEQPVDQELVAVDERTFGTAGVLGIEIALERVRDHAAGERVCGEMAERFALPECGLEELHRRDPGIAGRGGAELDGEQEGSQVAFELERQPVEMVPLEGGLVEACLRDEVIRDEVELGTFEDPERLLPDVLERGLGGDAGIREEFQDLPGPVQVLVPLDAGGIHPVLGGRLRGVGVPPDVINQAVDQIVVQAPEAMVGEGQQVDPHEVLVELLQPEDRVVRGQRRIIRDALGGNLEVGQHPAGDVV